MTAKCRPFGHRVAIFWTTLQAHSDSVCGSWEKNGPIPEVTGFLGFMAWEKSYEPAVGLPHNLRPGIPDPTSQDLGWAGIQAFLYRKMNIAPDKTHLPPLPDHVLALLIRSPAKT